MKSKQISARCARVGGIYSFYLDSRNSFFVLFHANGLLSIKIEYLCLASLEIYNESWKYSTKVYELPTVLSIES
jgi:hypothetical protein